LVLTETPLDAAVRRDLGALLARLEALPREHFCYRDFQSRNILWRVRPEGEGPVFLDYQSARRGPLAYDLASLLYSPDTGADEQERTLLTEAYLMALEEQGMGVEREAFFAGFYPLVLVRRLQALGAYARLAVGRGQVAYLDKIPPALATLRELLAQGRFSFGLPALERWLEQVFAESDEV
jgi:aminoglycoside/choline kinase family phosphotransferase